MLRSSNNSRTPRFRAVLEYSCGPTCQVAFLAACFAFAPAFAQSQARQQRIDVQDYAIKARIDPQAQTLEASAKVRFTGENLSVTDDVAKRLAKLLQK